MTKIRKIVRGETPLDHVPATQPIVNPDESITIEDVAAGLIRATSGELNQHWGRFILGELNVGLEACESHPEWDTILNAIWDVAFAIRPGDEAVLAARRIIGQSAP